MTPFLFDDWLRSGRPRLTRESSASFPKAPFASLGSQEPTLQALFDLPEAFCGVTAGPGASRWLPMGAKWAERAKGAKGS
jgi:hypothetical protein